MRFRITFQLGQSRRLPVDYQYFAGAWIYRVIRQADREYARFLHDHGFTDGNKVFKLFAYSPLQLDGYQLLRNEGVFEVGGHGVAMKVAFHLPDTAEKFIIGLFNRQQLFLGDRRSGLDLTVSAVERLPEPRFSRQMSYRLTSPAVFSIRSEGDRHPRYLEPENAGYPELVYNHLLQKMKVAGLAEPLLPAGELQMHLDGNWKSKLIRIRQETPQQTRVRGFLYNFTLDAPEAFHRLIYNAGFGEKNASGFGWTEITPAAESDGRGTGEWNASRNNEAAPEQQRKDN